MKNERSFRELPCNMIAGDKTWDEHIIATRNVQKTFEETLMTKRARKLAREPINIVRGFWDHYDRWHRSDLW